MNHEKLSWLWRVGDTDWVDVSCAASGRPRGQESGGNVDGFLTWAIGDLQPGGSADVTALLATAADYATAQKLLDRARSSPPQAADRAAVEVTTRQSKVPGEAWLHSPHTDFALAADGAFFWEPGGRQALSRAGLPVRRAERSGRRRPLTPTGRRGS